MTLKYFTEDEINNVSFGCEDGWDRMSLPFLEKLDKLREHLGFSLKLSCAFRTRQHDLDKGRSGNSKHTQGIAVDITCYSSTKRFLIIQAAYELGFTGVGIHKDFIHLDVREGTNVAWLY